MNSLIENFIFFINNYPHYKYLLMAIITILQGEVAIVLFVYLVLKKIISWPEFFIVTLSSIIIWENFIFLLGKNIRGSKFGWRIYKRIKENKKIHIYFYYLKENLTKLILISKFIPAVSIPFLFLIAWVKTKWLAFFKSYFISLFLWFLIMLVIAYTFNAGLFYLRENKIFKNIEILIGLFIILIFVVENLIKNILKKKISLSINLTKISDLFSQFFEEKKVLDKDKENNNET